MKFSCSHTDGRARRGMLQFERGRVDTPAFMPVGTYGTVKGMTPEEVHATGARILLGNTFHLMLRPGTDVVRLHGTLHDFMQWQGPILTDSGGFQVFSLSHLTKVDDDGATFASVIDGSLHRLTPERALEVQRDLGSDIAMIFDECPPGDAAREVVERAHRRTIAWARRARDLHETWGGAARGQALFGIVQGGTDAELRAESADAMVELGFDGYAVGGLSVGETKQQMAVALSAAVSRLPADRPRYLMGVGTPEDFRAATRAGVDLFDCVTPTRHGRNNQAFTRNGVLKLRNLKHAEDDAPLDAACRCFTCRRHSRAYLRHLAVSGEMLAGVLLSIHNIHYFQDVMADIRAEVDAGQL